MQNYNTVEDEIYDLVRRGVISSAICSECKESVVEDSMVALYETDSLICLDCVSNYTACVDCGIAFKEGNKTSEGDPYCLACYKKVKEKYDWVNQKEN